MGCVSASASTYSPRVRCRASAIRGQIRPAPLSVDERRNKRVRLTEVHDGLSFGYYQRMLENPQRFDELNWPFVDRKVFIKRLDDIRETRHAVTCLDPGPLDAIRSQSCGTFLTCCGSLARSKYLVCCPMDLGSNARHVLCHIDSDGTEFHASVFDDHVPLDGLAGPPRVDEP